MTTIRTIKLKRSSQAYGESAGPAKLSAPVATPADGAPTMESSTPAEAPAQAPEQAGAPTAAVAIKSVPEKSTVWFMLIALTAVIGLLIILGLQYSEMSFYTLAPSVWMPGR